MNENTRSVKIPLVIGVAAPRELEKLPEAAERLFAELKVEMAHTPLEFMISRGCGLAELLEDFGEVSEADESGIVDNANLLVVLGGVGACRTLVNAWQARLLDPRLPFAADRTDLVVYCRGSRLLPKPHPRGRGGDDPEYRFAHREQFETLRFIELFNAAAEDPAFRKKAGNLERSGEYDDYSRLLDTRYKIADGFSCESQRVYKRELNRLFAFSFVTGILINIYSGLNQSYGPHIAARLFGRPLSPVELALPVYLVLFVLMLAYYLFVRIGQSDKKYLEFRVLAEALRVQTFWHLGNVREGGAEADASDHLLRIEISRMEPVAVALRNWRRADRDSIPPVEHPDPGDVSRWIRGQLNYYVSSAAKRKKMRRLLKSVGTAALIFSFVAAAAYFAATLKYGPAQHRIGPFVWSPGDGLWLGLGPFLFAMMGYMIEKNALDEEIASYLSCGKMFETIDRMKPEDAGKMLLTLGREALREHESWLKLHRGRKPTPTC